MLLQSLANYSGTGPVPIADGEIPNPILLFVSGPSASGKNALIESVKSQRPQFVKSLSATTRKPRVEKGRMEVNGEDYLFVDNDEFNRMKAGDEFMEFAEVHGNQYGTPWVSLTGPWSKGKSIIGDLDVKGAESLRRSNDRRIREHLVTVFVCPPSLARMQRQMFHRNPDITEEEQERRIETACSEIPQAPKFNHVIINDKLDDASNELLEFVDMLTAPMPFKKRQVTHQALCSKRDLAVNYLQRDFGWAPLPFWAVRESPVVA